MSVGHTIVITSRSLVHSLSLSPSCNVATAGLLGAQDSSLQTPLEETLIFDKSSGRGNKSFEEMSSKELSSQPAQYVGPYRLEKTLGKGQTGKNQH